MPYLLSEWRDRIQGPVWEYRVAREALDRLKAQVAVDANAVHSSLSGHLRQSDLKLEGTYIVRVFAVFDAALRSYDRSYHNDLERETKVAVMIDQLGALRHIGVPGPIRAKVHKARRVRHYWAHELDENPGPMSLDRVRGSLYGSQEFSA